MMTASWKRQRAGVISPVCDHYRRPVGADLRQWGLDVPLSLGVQWRSGLLDQIQVCEDRKQVVKEFCTICSVQTTFPTIDFIIGGALVHLLEKYITSGCKNMQRRGCQREENKRIRSLEVETKWTFSLVESFVRSIDIIVLASVTSVATEVRWKFDFLLVNDSDNHFS